ncbi:MULTISPECIES: carotenoid oxygenase family protein [Sphingobium]|uniref:carotenoid oxygenase family protein n=1 Tax=Sphingobium TaxID=165695 RepID=UPI0015EB2C9D|nr:MULTISPECIES: carotenoid oxygenase family protein [Sphingobium]MCW2363216.1 carotenoid cleavage dioxygenase [Sphingobium sp. B10D3B]MCW2400104.1 carotenoid cleavage dioxygenase [Sphingobium sp. B10D7B]MCW2407082.1 carotenoid cleavage dioxygenase [Sphingobium xanthum]
MAHFPNTFGFTGTLRPLRLQGDIHDVEIEGEVPADLDGAFHRVHPDNQFAPKFEDDQFFNGDGMVSMFRVKDGKVDFRQRYAQTDKWKLENKAGKSLFGMYRNPLTDDPSVEGQIRGTANTNVLVHAGKLYAMKEDSPCLLMDPNTLETHGYTDFGGRIDSKTFCAHPKIDPATGNMCAFSYMSKGPMTHDMSYMEISPIGELLFEIPFQNKYLCMMHDFGVTEDYAVFSVMPLLTSMERLEKRLPYFGFDTTQPVWLAVLPRQAGATAADMRWFKAPSNCFVGHVMNAFNEGTRIYFDHPVAANNSFPFFPDIHGAPFDPIAGLGYLSRWSVDMASNSDEFESIEKLTNLADEFPRIDDRYATQAYRHGWMLVMDREKPYEGPGGPFVGMINSLAHIDLATGSTKIWWPGPQCGIQEPCFVPKSADAPEGDGYVIALVDNHVTNYSELCFFDAQHVDEGPIARAKLPMRIRQGLHGNWSTGAQLAGI